MNNVIDEFETRVAEIEGYFNFVAGLDEGSLKVEAAEGNIANPAPEIEVLVKTFKATALLMLYNLMESAVTNAIEAIFDELAERGVGFDKCREEIRKVVLSNARLHKPEKLLPQLSNIAVDIVAKTFRREAFVSGNVNARAIRSIAKQYGFTEPECRGDRLLTIKTHRNDLAHGSKSFAEVGRNFSIQDIREIKSDVFEYLREMFENVGCYIENKHYLCAPANVA